jgi:hypothetical protein
LYASLKFLHFSYISPSPSSSSEADPDAEETPELATWCSAMPAALEDEDER